MLRDTSKIWPNPICRVARHQNDPVADPFPDSNLPPTQSKLSDDWRARSNQGFVMSIEPSPHNKPARLGKFRGAAYADNVVPFHKDKALSQERELLHRGEPPISLRRKIQANIVTRRFETREETWPS